jgi:integrase
LEPRNLFRAFKAKLKRAALPDIRFHDLRHSAASLMLAQGVPLRVVMEVLGHSSISVTANTYSHVMPSLVQDATEKVAGVLFGG